MRRTETQEGRSVRLLRVGEQVRHVLSELLQRGDVHDEVLQTHLVSITEVRMSPDLRHATVFVKPLLGEDEEAVLKALRQNTAYLQREVARRVRMKYAAKLKFLRRRKLRRRHPHRQASARTQGCPGPRRRMIDLERLAEPMTGEGCRAELFSEDYRGALKAACAEDGEIWAIYANNFGLDGFDESIDRYTSNPNNRTFVLFEGDELAGMSSYLGIDPNRQVLEIGGTYYRPHLRGTGFNRRIKDMMLSRAFDCGIRRVEFRVDRRNGRSQAAMKKLGAVREGVMRADRITWTGHVRDTVLFAILKDEYGA